MTFVSTYHTSAGRELSKLELGSLSFLVAAMSFLLNHSTRAAGFNLSFADIFIALLFLVLFFTFRVYIPRYSILFFLALLSIVIPSAIWLTPALFEVHPIPRAVIGDLTKLMISFLYFIVGTSLARLGHTHTALKWFSIGAASVASLGLLMEVTGFRIFADDLYLGETRFRGFMSDPNFYSILACSAIVYFAYSVDYSRLVRLSTIAVLAFSIILSGSKTGLIALISITIITTLTRSFKFGKFNAVSLLLLFTGASAFLIGGIREKLFFLLEHLSQYIPQLERTSSLFSANPLEGISEDGSARDATWSIGLEMIELSPLSGVGVGTYSAVSSALFSQSGVAHNTYIQLAAEWGLIMAALLFAWIGFLLIKASRGEPGLARGTNGLDQLIVREIIIVFLIGSVSLSLNNARMFWLFLGILAYICYMEKRNNYSPKVK